MDKIYKSEDFLWRRSIHLVATRSWAAFVFGSQNVGSKFLGNDWFPQLLNPPCYEETSWITLKLGASREDFLKVWDACGGKPPTNTKLNAASDVEVARIRQNKEESRQ